MRPVFVIAILLAPGYLTVCAGEERVNIGLIYTESQGRKLVEDGTDDCRLYREAVEANGGTVVVLSQADAPEAVREHLGTIDALLVPGGIDVDPKFYDEERHEHIEQCDAALDEFEFELLKYAGEKKMPVLAICRGEQVLNVSCGGSLYQDIPSEYTSDTPVVHRPEKGGKSPLFHAIAVEKGSLLYEIAGNERIEVNTWHHQAVKRLAPGLAATARSDDGIIEAVEQCGETFVLGVQFHPEKTAKEDAIMNRIFERFVQEARKARSAKK